MGRLPARWYSVTHTSLKFVRNPGSRWAAISLKSWKPFTSFGAAYFVLDGEIVVPFDGNLAFDKLLQRIHPAESESSCLPEANPGGIGGI